MKIVADLHTHTIASTHAYSTITEMVNEAERLNLYALALTDHARTMPGAPGAYFFESLTSLPEVINNIRVIKGIEANISDYEGNIDVDEKLQETLEWIVASMHMPTLNDKPSVKKCTEAYLNLAENKNINVIGHSCGDYYKYDYEKVIPVLAEKGVLIEISDPTFRCNKSSVKNCIEIIKLCKKHNARVCVNSDAHYISYLGKVESSLKVLKDLNFPSELVVNSSVENLQEYFKEKKINF